MDVSRSRYHHPAAWDTEFEPLVLPEMLARAAKTRGEATFLHFLGRRYSYRAIHEEAQRFARGLAAMGIAPGDRVGLFLPNVPIYASAYYGAMMAGAVVVNFSPLYTVEELNHQVADSGTRLLVTLDVPELYGSAARVLEASSLEFLVVGALAQMLPWYKGLALRLLRRSQVARLAPDARIARWADVASDAQPALPARQLTPDDLALLQYTGGTTGRPKGAMLTHANLSINAQQVAAINPFDNPQDEVFMGALPFFHVFANTALLNHAVASGAAIAMVPRFETAQVLKTMAATRATGFPGVPTMFQALLDHPGLPETDLSALKVCISGGAPMPAPVHEKFEQVTGVRLVEGYGLTESSGVVSVNPYEGTRKRGTIGQVVPGTQVILLDKEDHTRLAPAGQPGELAVCGPQVMRGYWNRPEASAEVLIERDGKTWLRTGDVAEIDADGFLSIVDRIKDMIAVGGFKVFPSQLEDVILEHEGVKEALVIGVPHDYLGEMPRAFVTLESGAQVDGAQLREWLNARVGKHERVDEVVIREELPRTIIGKLDRKALRAEVLEG